MDAAAEQLAGSLSSDDVEEVIRLHADLIAESVEMVYPDASAEARAATAYIWARRVAERVREG